ncbi:FAD-dependent oxidoreductase [Pimelobacter simplex]|uniref:FAD-dependent oxidoreductase n=1 Tax=Nocardioides simplex TaxID=2045 RepID=UPI00345D4784
MGSGAAGLAAAITAAGHGLSVVVLEKSERWGGTTARSGGGVWVPGNPAIQDHVPAGDLAEARRYLHAIVDEVDPARIDTFVDPRCRGDGLPGRPLRARPRVGARLRRLLPRGARGSGRGPLGRAAALRRPPDRRRPGHDGALLHEDPAQRGRPAVRLPLAQHGTAALARPAAHGADRAALRVGPAAPAPARRPRQRARRLAHGRRARGGASRSGSARR